MIREEWGVKDHCAGCGFPCRKSACVNYEAGLDLQCDACMKTVVSGTLTATLPSAARAEPGHAVDLIEEG